MGCPFGAEDCSFGEAGFWRWVLALGFGVGFWRWVLVLGFGGPERARHDSPGQRPGLDAPMIFSPEGAAPLARENGRAAAAA